MDFTISIIFHSIPGSRSHCLLWTNIPLTRVVSLPNCLLLYFSTPSVWSPFRSIHPPLPTTPKCTCSVFCIQFHPRYERKCCLLKVGLSDEYFFGSACQFLLILKFIWKCKGLRIIQNNLEKNKIGRLMLLSLKTYCKTKTIKSVWCWHKESRIDQWNRIENHK